MVGSAHNRRMALERRGRQDRFIEEARRTGDTSRVIAERLGLSYGTYKNWRWEHDGPEFRARFDAAQEEGRRLNTKKVFNQYEEGNFVSFRWFYLKMETTWFQKRIADAIEAARPGEVTLILIPPEHGKTTLLEDWCTFKIAHDQSYRILVASEKVDHAIKVLARVKERFEPDGPTPAIARDFGPLSPADSGNPDQIWGAKYFNVAMKRETDERDYSMAAVGMTGGVQGTRCDLMLLDDIQDVKSTDLSDKYFEIITQSFLSRPSMKGRTVIIGTRVAEYDVYRKLIDKQIPDCIVRIPAYDIDRSPPWGEPKVKPSQDDEATWAPEGVRFLWPEMYDEYERNGARIAGLHRFRYAALRHRVGEQTWWRIYMQKPEAATAMTFDEKTTEAMKDEHRSVIAEARALNSFDTATIPPGESRRCPVIVSVDPSIGGGNGVISLASRPKELQILNCRLDYGLTKTAQIASIIDEECHRYTTETSFVSTVVVEVNAFQKGLLQDDHLLEVQKRFGFRLIPHTTTRNKSDPDIGVPSMAMAMTRQEITIPWADEVSIANMGKLLDQLHIWRPGLKGNKPGGGARYVAGKDQVPQDLTMALWFGYILWRATRDTPSYPAVDVANWRTTGSPLRRRRVSTATRARRPHAGGRRW
jgi:hypothetical protein